MADLIKEVPLVKVAVIHRKDIDQINFCMVLYLDDDSVPFQKEPGKDRRELMVIGWFRDGGNKSLLVQRVDDGRLLVQHLEYKRALEIAERHPQLFIR